MVGSALTLALIGLSAVSRALPAGDSVKERQTFGLGPPTSTFGSGSGSSPCLADVPLNEQPPCILTVIGGGVNPPKGKRFTLPPDYNHDIKKAIATLELQLEGLQNKKYKTDEDKEEIADIKEALKYLAGISSITAPPGTGSTFTPGKRFTLPPDYNHDIKKAIATLELQLEGLQNKKYKTDEDKEEIADIKAALKYLAGISSISAPPGTGSTFTPGKRFTLPPDYNSDIKGAIASLELQLEALQNKKHKTAEDKQEIADIKAALKYLVGITNISAPPGTGSTFTPGKRSELGEYANECPGLEGAELAYERLIQQDHLSFQETVIAERLKGFLKACGITIVKQPDGTTTIIKPSDKRDVFTAPFDLVGLEKAYEALIQSVGTTKPSFSTWQAIQHMEAVLKLYGITIEKSPAGTTTTIRPGRRQTFTIGKQTCQLSDMLGLKAALAALYAAYGSPDKAPQNIFLIEQVIVSALTLCGQTVNGWTTLTPGNPIPGGAIVPDPTTPGGPIVPDPTTPGAPIKPSDRRRQAPISDPAALLEALLLLESKYGNYGSGTIPVPIFLIMENMVTILQDIPGVTVPGWPILGAGSTTIKPSD